MSTQTNAHQLHNKIRLNESGALAYVYILTAGSAAILFYLIYRASQLINHGSTGINAKSYLVTHSLTALLEVILWLVIARAAVRFKSYTRTVITSDDGRALNFVANALLLSLVYAIFFGMASTIKTLFVHTAYLKAATTITNLGPLLIILLATLWLFSGTQKLRRIPHSKLSRTPSLIAVLVYLGAVVAYMIYFYQVAPRLLDDDGLHHFVWPARTLLFVYALPYAVVWLLGLLACLNLASYSNHVEGKIYKPLLRNLYKGLIMSFVGTYLVQIFYVSNVSSNRFGVGLLVILALIGLLIYGSFMVYRGSSQLFMLEK